MEIQTDLDANVIDNVNNCEVRRAKHAIIFIWNGIKLPHKKYV